MGGTANDARKPKAKHVVVVGGGVVGVCTAYLLATTKQATTPNDSNSNDDVDDDNRAVRVTLLEADEELAGLTSFGNAGRFCPTTLLKGPPASPQGIAAAFRTLLPRWMSGTTTTTTTSSTPAIEHGYAKQAMLTPGLAAWGLWYLRNCATARH